MNSTEEIKKYSDSNSHYCSPTLSRRTAAQSYDFQEKFPKKEKKWSFGSIFRRRKKNDSDSSSEEEAQKRSFLQKKKKKNDKQRKRPNKTVGTFDHIVIPPKSRSSHSLHNGYRNGEEPSGIFSEPTFGFAEPIGRDSPKSPVISEPSATVLRNNVNQNGLNLSHNSLGSTSLDSLGKRSRRDRVKARVEAKKNNLKNCSSSDEDSQRSVSSSRLRSDEYLNRQHRDGSLSRKSRTARTERYFKRLSKDDEGKDPKYDFKSCKSDVENGFVKISQRTQMINDLDTQNIISHRKSPVLSMSNNSKLSYTSSAPSSRSNISGLSTIPPSHSTNSKYRLNNVNGNFSTSQPKSYQNGGHKYSYSDVNNRSLSYDADIHQTMGPEDDLKILHVQFPLGIPYSAQRNTHITQHNSERKHPPPPPPRDPRRTVTIQQYDNGRPISYSFETGYLQNRSENVPFDKNRISRTLVTGTDVNYLNGGKSDSYQLQPNQRSTSQDHIYYEPKQRAPVVPRPSSVTPEATRMQGLISKSLDCDFRNEYRYLADKNPRSRKPITIQSFNKVESNNTPSTEASTEQNNKTQKALDFWRQKEEQLNLSKCSNYQKPSTKPSSPQMFIAQTHVKTNIFLPSALSGNDNFEQASTKSKSDFQRNSSPFRPISPSANGLLANAASNSSKSVSPDVHPSKISASESVEKRKKESVSNSVDEVDCADEIYKRKSSNLEEALDELEAIYNSLRLGDEDLLERAERREAAIQKSQLGGTMSDSSFTCDFSPRKKRFSKRSLEADRTNDDMAFRKLHKERANTISDPQSVVSNVSYLLASPVHGISMDEPVLAKSKNKEPDITLDDVVYRSVKYSNNILKLPDPQPPFGIPLGPVTPAANSDYLHATPEANENNFYKPKKIPDIVKDDLAYRSLRKDFNKDPALPQAVLNPDDFVNNNKPVDTTKHKISNLKKKRAVRSLSANIFNLMQKDSKYNASNSDNEFDKAQSLTDIADAMEIAHQILREKENKTSSTKNAFISDSETKYSKYGSKNCTYANSLREDRLNFLNQMKQSKSEDGAIKQKLQVNVPLLGGDAVETKPPTPKPVRQFVKESTPIPSSPSDSPQNDSQSSTLEELLTALAVEARETSERITNELKMLCDEKDKNLPRDKDHKHKRLIVDELDPGRIIKSSKSPDRKTAVVNRLRSPDPKPCNVDNHTEAQHSNINEMLSDIDSVSERAKQCEKLLESVVESTELIASTKIETEPMEEVDQITCEPMMLQSVANIILTPTNASEKSETNPITAELYSESEHDYANIQSNDEMDKDLAGYGESVGAKKSYHDIDSVIDEITRDCGSTSNSPISKSNKVPFPMAVQEDTDLDSELEHIDDKRRLVRDSIPQRENCRIPNEKNDEKISVGGEYKSSYLVSLKNDPPHNIKQLSCVEQTDKDGGETCVCVDCILLPDRECAFDSDYFGNLFNMDRFNSFSTVGHVSNTNVNVQKSVRFDLNATALQQNKHKDDFKTLENLTSPKLVQVLNSNTKLLDEQSNCSSLNNENLPLLNETELSKNCYIQQEFALENTFDKRENNPCSNDIKQPPSVGTLNKSPTKNLDSSCLDRLSDSGCKISPAGNNSLGESSRSRDSRHTLDKTKPSSSWYRDPAILAIACSYGLACTQQLASMDFITVLGILFAIIALLAAIVVR